MDPLLSTITNLVNQNQLKNQLETLEKKVSKIVSSLFHILGPCVLEFEPVLNESNLINEEHHYNLLNFGHNFLISIIDLIDREQEQRENHKQSVVVLGLRDKSDDNRQINRIFKALKQPLPTEVKRLKTVNSNKYPEPVICKLKSEKHVDQILNNSYKLQLIKEFKNVYINQHLTKNERIIDSIIRQNQQK
ncbi:unnamed protein product, partial [Brachionus calyciflorus]